MTPYANYRFRLLMDGRPVAGISKVGGLSRTTEVIRHREGADPSTIHLDPVQTDHAPITLERGVSYDAVFGQWVGSATGRNLAPQDVRKTLTIQVWNEAGQEVMAYVVHDAWVSEFHAMSDLDGSGNALVIESMTLQNEGWERDASVVPPGDPDFTPPTG